MKTSNFLFGFLVGAVAMHILHRRGYMKNKVESNPKVMAIQAEVQAVQDVVEEEASKFSNVLKSEYDIVMLPNKISKRAKEKAKVFTEGRYAVDPTSVKPPLAL